MLDTEKLEIERLAQATAADLLIHFLLAIYLKNNPSRKEAAPAIIELLHSGIAEMGRVTVIDRPDLHQEFLDQTARIVKHWVDSSLQLAEMFLRDEKRPE